jgi:CIC family chloride channel protein
VVRTLTGTRQKPRPNRSGRSALGRIQYAGGRRPATPVLVFEILLFVPQVMGVGYEYVDQVLNGGMLVKTMLLLCAVKLPATIISYASGNAGGIFGPSLYIGAMAGGVVGMVVHRLAPFPTAGPGAYALVGMGALFAGIIRAPMTSVFMIFELTQDYQILAPLMITNMLSFIISRRFQPTPVYHALLEQNHIYMPGPETRFGAVAWRARDIMARQRHHDARRRIHFRTRVD